MGEAETTVEETYTYEITLGVSTRYIGSDVEETVPLKDYGYSDQEWDDLSPTSKDQILNDLIEQYLWENTEYWGRVENANGEEV